MAKYLGSNPEVPCLKSATLFCFKWVAGIAGLLRFQYLKAFLLDRNLSSIQVTSYFEEFLEFHFVREKESEIEIER